MTKHIMATASLLKEDYNYIETYGIHQIFVNAAVQLCAIRPEFPFTFLRQYFQVLESVSYIKCKLRAQTHTHTRSMHASCDGW